MEELAYIEESIRYTCAFMDRLKGTEVDKYFNENWKPKFDTVRAELKKAMYDVMDHSLLDPPFDKLQTPDT